MKNVEFSLLMKSLRKQLDELRRTGFQRRTNPDGSFVWEDCEPLSENFRSAGRPANSEQESTIQPA